MKGSQEGEEKRHLSIEPVPAGKGRFLKTGFFSLLLHIALIALVVLNLRLVATKCEPTVCQVMIKPFLPPEKGIKPARPRSTLARKSSLPPLLPEETRVQKEEKKWIQEADLPEPAPVKKSMDQEMPAPVEPVVAEISFKKPELLPPQEEPKTAKPQEEPKTARLQKKTEDSKAARTEDSKAARTEDSERGPCHSSDGPSGCRFGNQEEGEGAF